MLLRINKLNDLLLIKINFNIKLIIYSLIGLFWEKLINYDF